MKPVKVSPAAPAPRAAAWRPARGGRRSAARLVPPPPGCGGRATCRGAKGWRGRGARGRSGDGEPRCAPHTQRADAGAADSEAGALQAPTGPAPAPEGRGVEAPGRAQHALLHVVEQQGVVHRAVAGANVLEGAGHRVARLRAQAGRATGAGPPLVTWHHLICSHPTPQQAAGHHPGLACGVPPGRKAPQVSLVVAKPMRVGTLMHTLPYRRPATRSSNAARCLRCGEREAGDRSWHPCPMPLGLQCHAAPQWLAGTPSRQAGRAHLGGRVSKHRAAQRAPALLVCKVCGGCHEGCRVAPCVQADLLHGMERACHVS